MTVTANGPRRSGGGYLERPAPSGLVDVIDSILDKGLVIDAYIRVSLVGIELLTIDARIVIASVDTYLRFAEATSRLNLEEKAKDLPEVINEMTENGAKGKSKGLLTGAKEALLGDDNDEDEDEDEDDEADRELEEAREQRRRRPARKSAARRRRADES